MSGIRWTTGVGIALGGTGGAIAALLGVPGEPARPPPLPQPAALRLPVPVSSVSAAGHAAPSAAAPSATAPSAATPSAATPSAVAAAANSPATIAAALASASPAPAPPAGLDIPSTRPALLKAMLHCDQKQDFDACASVAVALDSGTTGPADPEQAKRFRKIALTHLVAQCEAASAHACLVLAAKYRAGTELTQNLKGAEALEQRADELCRLRPGAGCPSPP